MDYLLWTVTALTLLALLGFAVRRLTQPKPEKAKARPEPVKPLAENEYKISYAPSQNEWSGSSGILPLKILTYKQYECLEDARYGFKIVGVKRLARKDAQPHKTRAHDQKTVASLTRHGFLVSADGNAHVITDLGLNALAVCGVRY